MNRPISTLLVAIVVMIAAPSIATADEPPDPPTAQRLEAAKKAFAEGKKLHDAGKLPEAIEKFKESYRLSKNPLLLYNIALTMEEAQMEDLALFYFRKFLADAPAEAAQRATVIERVKLLEKKFGGSAEPAKDPAEPARPADPKPADPRPADPATRPAGTYSASDFEHQLVDAAPPGKPLDVTAFVPQDSGFVVTLYYRTAGEGKFTGRPMKWRYKELVARIPAPKMIGTSVQYYLEVKDAAGAVVTRSGKSTSPNQVLLETTASPRFYPDVADEPDPAPANTGDTRASDDSDDPLSGRKHSTGVVVQPTGPSDGPPSGRLTYAKWGATGFAAVALGFGVFSWVQAGKYASALEDDSTECGNPPCRAFDDVAAGYEDTGKRYQLLFRVGVGAGVAVGAVAGYLWWREARARKRGAAPSTAWHVAPAIDHGYAGAAAAVRF